MLLPAMAERGLSLLCDQAQWHMLIDGNTHRARKLSGPGGWQGHEWVSVVWCCVSAALSLWGTPACHFSLWEALDSIKTWKGPYRPSALLFIFRWKSCSCPWPREERPMLTVLVQCHSNPWKLGSPSVWLWDPNMPIINKPPLRTADSTLIFFVFYFIYLST
jgi:hypothetical protein